MQDSRSNPILVVSDSWQTRSLLAGELGERVGRDILPSASIDEALGLIKLAGVDPSVVVVDAGQSMSAEDVETLLEANRDVPLVLVASGLRQKATDHVRDRCAAYLVRPVRIGTIAETVVDLVGVQDTSD